MEDQKPMTHFGFETVPWDQKEKKVKQVFHSVANHYDQMNDLMSLGIHRLWKKFAVSLSGLLPGQEVLDLAGGSGDLTKLLVKKVGPSGRVVLADINQSMLCVGRDRMLNAGILKPVQYTIANAECLPFKDQSFHCVMIAFGLRNVTDKQAALRSMARVCKPGGKLLILEFSMPDDPVLKAIYDAYSFNILPKLGGLIAKDQASYQYLAESIRMHPGQNELKSMIEEAGFEDCKYYNLSGGIVALHVAYIY